MRVRLAATAALVALVPFVGQAQSFDGTYKLTPDATCSSTEGEGLLRIEDGMFYGAESSCRMTAPLSLRAMTATVYDMVCLGEGSGWQERAMLMKAASGGLILVWDGYAFEYEACPKPPVRPRARPDRD